MRSRSGQTATFEHRETGGVATLGRRALLGRLAQLQDGELTIVEPAGRHVFGRSTPDFDVAVNLEVLDPQFWADAAFGGSVGAGDSYIRGHWRTSDLTGLVRLMIRNYDVLHGLDRGVARLSAPLHRLLHWLNRNTRAGSRRNIAAHYDLGNEFFRHMLDPTMAYSCAIYATPASTLDEAQRLKFDVICRKLQLEPGDELLEIGSGWGGLAIHAAREYGCRVTTTTISREQHAYTREAIRAAGLESRITLLLEDYRDLRGRFDKLASVEMLEAVGQRFMDDYFRACAGLLKPHGAMLLQAITLQDQLYEKALGAVDFIQRFVFPGGFLPSVTAITASLRRVTDLKLFHLEDIGPHYVTTLADWRRNLHARIGAVRAPGYPAEFLRLWDFYLSYCEGGFAERQLGDVQMLLTKPRCRRPPLAMLTA